MLLLIDNYDSFTYNLAQYAREVGGARVTVARNDKIALEDVGRFDKILVSPGPGLPSEAGILPELLQVYAPLKPVLGVCLGLQAIGEAFGGRLKNLADVYHGVATPVHVVAHDPLFAGLPVTFPAGRYHSWVVDETDFPADLEITATDDRGLVMALRHRRFDVRGVQFHPESVLTPHGKQLIHNWILA